MAIVVLLNEWCYNGDGSEGYISIVVHVRKLSYFDVSVLLIPGSILRTCRKLADNVAAAGFYVVVPDFFYGDPYDPDNAEKPLPVWKSMHEPVCSLLPNPPLYTSNWILTYFTLVQWNGLTLFVTLAIFYAYTWYLWNVQILIFLFQDLMELSCILASFWFFSRKLT